MMRGPCWCHWNTRVRAMERLIQSFDGIQLFCFCMFDLDHPDHRVLLSVPEPTGVWLIVATDHTTARMWMTTFNGAFRSANQGYDIAALRETSALFNVHALCDSMQRANAVGIHLWDTPVRVRRMHRTFVEAAYQRMLARTVQPPIPDDPAVAQAVD